MVVIALVLGACGPGKTAPAAWEKSLSPFRVMKENPPIRKVPIPFRQDGPPLEAAPAITPKPLRLLTPTSPPTSVPEHEVEMDIIIVVDNYPSRPGWETTWGFSALVEVEGRLLLFDTGGDGPLLLRNLARQDVDPHSIRQVVISHAHRDHTGGIASLLSTRGHPELYLPPDLVEAYRCGTYAVELASQGRSGVMVSMRRVSNSPYKIEFGTEKLENVAIKAKPMPDNFINADGNYPTKDFFEYAAPLVGKFSEYVTLRKTESSASTERARKLGNEHAAE